MADIERKPETARKDFVCCICGKQGYSGQTSQHNRTYAGQTAHWPCYINNGFRFPSPSKVQTSNNETAVETRNVKSTVGALGALEESIREIVNDALDNYTWPVSPLDETAVLGLIEKHAVLKSAVQPKKNDAVSDITEKIVLDGKHCLTEYVRYLLSVRKYPFLHGNPGGGKSFLAQQLAEDMEIDFYAISCAPDMFKSELLGSVSPVNGQYIKGLLYDAFKSGGVVLLDEVCLASGSFLNVLCNSMANRSLRFPNGELVKMHKNFFLILADNSTGYGNDPLFPERQDVGQAFRDRVKYVNFTYDTALELSVITGIMKDGQRAQKWHETVLKMREAVSTKHRDVPVFVSPRFAYDAAVDFVHGRRWSEIVESGLYKGLNGDIHRMVHPTISAFQGEF